MSFPNHTVDTGGSNGNGPQQSFNPDSSSSDSDPSFNYNDNVNGELDKSDISQPLPDEQQNDDAENDDGETCLIPN